MNRKPRSTPAVSRRRFVTLMAAGSAALIATPALTAAPALSAADDTRRKGTSTPSAKPAPPAPVPVEASRSAKELARQRAGTLATLKVVRDYLLPPGGDLPVVFRPQRSSTKGAR